MNSYDKYKEGLHYDNSPINRKQDESEFIPISELACECDRQNEVLNTVSSLRTRVERLRMLFRATENEYALKKLNEIYNLL